MSPQTSTDPTYTSLTLDQRAEALRRLGLSKKYVVEVHRGQVLVLNTKFHPKYRREYSSKDVTTLKLLLGLVKTEPYVFRIGPSDTGEDITREEQLDKLKRIIRKVAARSEAEPTSKSTRERPAKQESEPEQTKPERVGRFWMPDQALAMPITPHEFKVYAALSRRAGTRGVCWPRREVIAEDCGLDLKTVHEARNRLRELKMIDWRKGKFGASNTYTILPPHGWIGAPQSARGTGDQSSRLTGAQSSRGTGVQKDDHGRKNKEGKGSERKTA